MTARPCAAPAERRPGPGLPQVDRPLKTGDKVGAVNPAAFKAHLLCVVGASGGLENEQAEWEGTEGKEGAACAKARGLGPGCDLRRAEAVWGWGGGGGGRIRL